MQEKCKEVSGGRQVGRMAREPVHVQVCVVCVTCALLDGLLLNVC